MRTYIKMTVVVLALALVLTSVGVMASAATATDTDTTLSAMIPGDVNGDNAVNAKDLTRLMKYLSTGEVAVAWNAVDINGDGVENAKDLTRLKKYLAGTDVEMFLTQASGITCTPFVYGLSELGRDLVCYSISGETYDRTILLNFEIHGFEDMYDHDGEALVNAANALIDVYKSSTLLAENNCRLLIIPSANPDGLIDGYTNNGTGRCNINGIDLNRDFDANYSPNTSSARYYTPYAFSAAESRALRDLCLAEDPDVVLDMHGWLNTTIGDPELAAVFYAEMGLPHQVGFTSTNCQGYFANWAHQQGALALLVEFTDPAIDTAKLINAVDRLVEGDYDDGTGSGSYAEDERYAQFAGAQGYTISTGRVTTYQGFDVPFPTVSYIDGTTDLCTVNTIYANGWVKVTYPISSGMKTAYCKLSDFIAESEAVAEPYQATVKSTTTMYRRSDLAGTALGSATVGGEIWVVGETATAVQIMYKASGNWLLGWVPANSIIV